MTEHTPTPWICEPISATTAFIQDVSGILAQRDARFIVQACNHYEDAIRCLRRLADELNAGMHDNGTNGTDELWDLLDRITEGSK